MQTGYLKTPLGWVKATMNGTTVTGLSFVPGPGRQGKTPPAPLAKLKRELTAYFAGKLKRFTVPFEQTGTEFQVRVWREISKIPYGKTKSYTQVARAAGRPKAVRAVGTTCGSNQLWLLVPCHRVVASGGSLGGYGGGLKRKAELLSLEKEHA